MTSFLPVESQNKWTEILRSIDYKTIESFLKEQQEEEEYLKKRAAEFLPTQSKNYQIARSIVLDIHSQLDYIISVTLGLICIFGRKGRVLNKDKVDLSELTQDFYATPYSRRLMILEKLKVFTDSTVKILRNVNKLRNGFAHIYNKQAKHYEYGGESIFKKENIDKLIKDFEIVRKEYKEFLKSDELLLSAGAGINSGKADNE